MDSEPPSMQTTRISAPPQFLDTILLRGLRLTTTFLADAWGRQSKVQPITLDIALSLDTTSAASTDDIDATFSYGTLCSSITSKISEGSFFFSLDDLTSILTSFAEDWPGEALKIHVVAPKAILRAEGGLSREIFLKRRSNAVSGGPIAFSKWHLEQHFWAIKGLKLACIIGVNAHERLEKQAVVLDVDIGGEEDESLYEKQTKDGHAMWRCLGKRICEVVEASEFLTVEALVGKIAGIMLEEFPMPWAKVRCEKPSALASVDGAGVEIWRHRSRTGRSNG